MFAVLVIPSTLKTSFCGTNIGFSATVVEYGRIFPDAPMFASIGYVAVGVVVGAVVKVTPVVKSEIVYDNYL